MEYSSSSPSQNQLSASSLFPMESSPLEISDEAFNLFHSIDRELYKRLIHNLGREAGESVQVIAFWMWLEKESKDMNLIKRFLSFTLPHLNALADETVVCLRCVESDLFLYANNNDTLTLLPEVVNDRISNVISLRLFHENRVAVSRAITRIINTVCTRAFRDIPPHSGGGRGQPMYHVNVPFPVAGPSGLLGMAPRVDLPGPLGMAPRVDLPVHLMQGAAQHHHHHHHEMVMNMNNQLLEEINININNIIDDGEVPADDRTVFLTFSKGYPITEDEVTEFFTRRFGDFIEDLIMQDVGDEEQVLYARMVARSASLIDDIVGGNKAKYVINGKHVWARKYVKKHHQFPPPRTATRCQEASSPPPSSSTTTTVHGEQP